MKKRPISTLLEDDKKFVWHPYNSMLSDDPVFSVESANGTKIMLHNGSELIDGMSSWWCAIHGYNVAELNDAITHQLQKMAHVMFGGLTHEPAVSLCKKLVEITPSNLDHVFLTDSGSVSIEVAMKMAIQYWHAKQLTKKQKFISLRNGYHGDTLGAMSVCDPINGMHTLFNKALIENHFISSPTCKFDETCLEQHLDELNTTLATHHKTIAAFILEPVVQGAGGMKFYSPDYLKKAKLLCEKYNVLLIADEIATGFGRTGKLFACEHADIFPDIMCIGKSLTGGYMTLAATLCSKAISETISNHTPNVFMHGPTFMGNPLACATALASINKLLASDWKHNIQRIETSLNRGLEKCTQLNDVVDVRVLGAIGVVELKNDVNMPKIQQAFVDAGVWIRPFGKLIYLMPPYIIKEDEINILTNTIFNVLRNEKHR